MKSPRASPLRGLSVSDGSPALRLGDVRCLKSLRTFDDVERDALAFLEAAEPVTCDGAVMDENVLAIVLGDEPVALLAVEPLDHSLSHSLLTPFPCKF